VAAGDLHESIQPAAQGIGHLFSGRYKALPVEGSGNGYLKTACDYVHLNPVRAKLLRAEQALECFRWSSYGLYLVAFGLERARPRYFPLPLTKSARF
jgi:hypothetical protein